MGGGGKGAWSDLKKPHGSGGEKDTTDCVETWSLLSVSVSGWMASPESSGYVELEAFKKGMKDLGRLATALGRQSAGSVKERLDGERRGPARTGTG